MKTLQEMQDDGDVIVFEQPGKSWIVTQDNGSKFHSVRRREMFGEIGFLCGAMSFDNARGLAIMLNLLSPIATNNFKVI